MHGKSTYTIVPASPRARAVPDEWGLFDPNQAGLKAAIRASRGMNAPTVPTGAPESAVREIATEPIPRTSATEPTIHATAPRQIVPASAPAPAIVASAAEALSEPERHEDVNTLTVPESQPEAQAPRTADKGAVYTLEFPTRCPQCCQKISTVRVSRLLRTQVSFTSTLPRKGYIIVCPECDGMVSAELSGLI